MHCDDARWRRVERYARSRQRRFRLDHLPYDVLGVVVAHLPHEAVCTLLHVLFDAPAPCTAITSRYEARVVPSEVRYLWLHGAACDTLCRALRSFAESALFHTRDDFTYAAAHLDWSIFSGTAPRALCTYSWASPHASCVTIDNAEVHAAVEECVGRARCSATLMVHRYLKWGNTTFMHPDPVVRATHIVFPHFVMSELPAVSDGDAACSRVKYP
jgi:hypothetical protein